MKYNININQLALSKTQLDIIDGAILDYLYFLCNSKNKKIEKERKNGFTWLNYKHLLRDMPLLGIKSKGAITVRLKKIEKEGFIKTLKDKNNKIYVDLTEKFEELLIEKTPFNTVHENEQGVFTKMNRAVHVDEQDNNTNNNNTNNTISKEIGKNPTSYGNKDINSLLSLLKEVNNGLLDGSIKENRRYCWLLLNSMDYKNNPEKAVKGAEVIIKLSKMSNFHSKNATSFKYLYKHKAAIIAEYKGKVKDSKLIKL